MPQFRTKARAVDLLGKGQIADLPTAISELWKNGYDAYGDNLEAFLYMTGYKDYDQPIFVLSDDGKGMDNADILDKWFVLGTDSKSRNEPDKKGAETLGKEPRVKMGEKGIGRLAVAYLGPQMLMLTKKRSYPLEMVLFDWRILENYELFLSDINIPVKAISSSSEFTKAFNNLKKDFLKNFPQIKLNEKDPWKDQKKLKDSIINDCNQLQTPGFIINDVIDELLKNPTKNSGTKFIIFQPDQQITNLRNFTKNDENEDYTDHVSVNYTVSTLVGLFNLFKTENSEYKTHFWIYDKDSTGRYDLLTFKSFFNLQDFKDCDHLIEGTFDEEGEFNGKVRIYRKTINHKFRPIKKKAKTNYGPFTIKLGYVQDRADESLIAEEQKRVFEEKLELYSGLFIYRDGFRVLPYGRPDTDFLEFEERRSKGAGTYFFSKRRMFGYIEITREENKKLIDKSSREGFINNQAFSDFKVDLIAFFKDLAKKYFATHAEEPYKSEQQEDLKNKAEAERQEHERDKEARKEFAKKINSLPDELNELNKIYDSYINQLEKKSNEVNVSYDEMKQLLSNIEECKVKLSELKIAKPARFQPTDLQKKKLYAYNRTYKEVVGHFDESEKVLRKVRNKLKVHELFKEFENKAEFYKNVLSNQFQESNTQLENIFDKIRNEVNKEKELFISGFDEKYNSIVPSAIDAEEISRSMKLLENIFKESHERITNRISPYLAHLERLNLDVNEDNLVGFYKDRFEEMKEEWNKTYELAQLGIAVEIIDHQFNTLYSELAETIRSMKVNLVPGKESDTKYKSLSIAFEHLQNNYKLLQPLYRTTGRIRTDITALELKNYVEEFFKTRLEENKIKLLITKKGEKWSALSYESIFKPVLINIINNAIFWLQPVNDRQIIIDAKGDELLIMNSGLPIEDYILKDIFKLFFSERPKGRGIGLYLAKQSLNGIGYDIEASNDPKHNLLNGACFIIKSLNIK